MTRTPDHAGEGAHARQYCGRARWATAARRAAIPRCRSIVTALLAAAVWITPAPTLALADVQPAWTTYHHDAARSGVDPYSLSPISPRLAWQTPMLDGKIFAQPLVYGSRVYVATENNTVYALDAATGAVVWSRSAGTPVPAGSLACGNIAPTVGITGTPVIDPATNAIYAVADTWDGNNAQHVLVGNDLASGAPLARRSVDPPGSVHEDLLQRAALALDGGAVVIGFGGNAGDCGTYSGWLVAAREDGSGSPLVFQAAPQGGAIWGGGAGPAVDGAGNIFTATGNGLGNSMNPAYAGSESVVRLDAALTETDHYAPPNWAALDSADLDLGSTSPLPLPSNLLFQGGKTGIGYLLSAPALGGTGGMTDPALYSHQVCTNAGSYGGEAFAAAIIYVPCADGVRALALDTAGPSFSQRWQGPTDANGPPIVAGGQVWVVATATHRLYGLDPSGGTIQSQMTLPGSEHFTSPSAGGGRLFVASGSQVTALQIASFASPAVSNASPVNGAVGGPGGLGVLMAPTLTSLSIAPSTFAAAPSGASIARGHRGGTTITYRDSQAAITRFQIYRTVAGVHRRGACVRASRRSRGRRCWLYVAIGSFTHRDFSGRNSFHFTGRINADKLSPASYRLRATPTAGGQAGHTVLAGFRVIR